MVVDNGSTDDTAKVLAGLATSALGAWFRVVAVMPNEGYGNGLWSGLRTTTARIVGWSHADMQCDPKDAIAAFGLVNNAKDRPLLVKGARSGRNAKDVFVSRVFETNARMLLNLDTPEINAQPKVFPRELLATLSAPPKTFAFDLYVLYHARKDGYAITTIPVVFPPRIHGTSKWAATFFGRYKTILGMLSYMWHLLNTEGRL